MFQSTVVIAFLSIGLITGVSGCGKAASLATETVVDAANTTDRSTQFSSGAPTTAATSNGELSQEISQTFLIPQEITWEQSSDIQTGGSIASVASGSGRSDVVTLADQMRSAIETAGFTIVSEQDFNGILRLAGQKGDTDDVTVSLSPDPANGDLILVTVVYNHPAK